MNLTNQVTNKAKCKPLNNLAGLTIILSLCIASPASAGLLRVSVDPGTSVGIAASSDNQSFSDGATDTNNDKVVEFAIPEALQNDTNPMVTIAKDSDGREIIYKINIIPNGVTLASLEPFDVPTFVADDPNILLVANVDIVNFLNEGNPFTVGDQFTTDPNGIISGVTSTITFLDGSTLSNLNPEERAVELINSIDLLPVFASNDLEVTPFDQFRPVPEPSYTLSLVALSTLGAASTLKRKLKPSKEKELGKVS